MATPQFQVTPVAYECIPVKKLLSTVLPEMPGKRPGDFFKLFANVFLSIAPIALSTKLLKAASVFLKGDKLALDVLSITSNGKKVCENIQALWNTVFPPRSLKLPDSSPERSAEAISKAATELGNSVLKLLGSIFDGLHLLKALGFIVLSAATLAGIAIVHGIILIIDAVYSLAKEIFTFAKFIYGAVNEGLKKGLAGLSQILGKIQTITKSSKPVALESFIPSSRKEAQTREFAKTIFKVGKLILLAITGALMVAGIFTVVPLALTITIALTGVVCSLAEQIIIRSYRRASKEVTNEALKKLFPNII